MFGGRGFGFIFFIFIAALPCSISRKRYDIDEECHKLFHEDLSTVLLRFRKTPQYHRILQEKFDDYIEGTFTDTRMQIQRYYVKKLEFKVKALMGIKDDSPTTTTADKSWKHSENLEFQDVLVRKNSTPIERLDSYHLFNSPLTVAQKNSMKDLGFQYAGLYIDELVKHVIGNLKDVPPQNNRTTKKIVWLNQYGEPDIPEETTPATREGVVNPNPKVNKSQIVPQKRSAITVPGEPNEHFKSSQRIDLSKVSEDIQTTNPVRLVSSSDNGTTKPSEANGTTNPTEPNGTTKAIESRRSPITSKGSLNVKRFNAARNHKISFLVSSRTTINTFMEFTEAATRMLQIY